MAPTLIHANGRTVTVPDGAEGVYLENGWAIPGAVEEPKAKRGRKPAVKNVEEVEGATDGADAAEGDTVSSYSDDSADNPS